jgi:hypothetical protein
VFRWRGSESGQSARPFNIYIIRPNTPRTLVVVEVEKRLDLWAQRFFGRNVGSEPLCSRFSGESESLVAQLTCDRDKLL